MNVLTYLRSLFSVGIDPMPVQLEGRRQALEHACSEQQDLLHRVRQGLIEVAIGRQELRCQVEELRARLPQLEALDRPLLAGQHDDLGRPEWQHQQICLAELTDLDEQLIQIAEAEETLTLVEQQFARRMEYLRWHCSLPADRCLRATSQAWACYQLPASANWVQVLEQARVEIEKVRARAAALGALMGACHQVIPASTRHDSSVLFAPARFSCR